MKKDRMYELMTELRNRRFDFNELYRLFEVINAFVATTHNRNTSLSPTLSSYWDNKVDETSMLLEKVLRDFGLEYTIDEFITFD